MVEISKILEMIVPKFQPSLFLLFLTSMPSKNGIILPKFPKSRKLLREDFPLHF